MPSLLARFRTALSNAPEPSRLAAIVWLCGLAVYFIHRAWIRDGLELWERAAFVACATALPLGPRPRRIAAAVALLWFYVFDRLARAPFTAANHEWLEAWLLAALAVAPGGAGALRRVVMAATVVVLAWTGVQKLANGFYLPGDYFSISAAQPSEKFGEPLLKRLDGPKREEFVAFYRDYRAHLRAGSGPLDRPLPRVPWYDRLSRAACWLTLLFELAGAALLVPRRTRRPAALALVAFFLGVEAVAHEWVFGVLTALLLLPFLCRRPADREGGEAPLVPVAACGALLALLALWPAAQMVLVRTTGLSEWKLGGFGMYSVPARFGEVIVEGKYGDAWVELPPSGEAEKRVRSSRGYSLRHAPFARSAAADIARAAIEAMPEEARPVAVRVRSRTMRYDRPSGRFHPEERIHSFP